MPRRYVGRGERFLYVERLIGAILVTFGVAALLPRTGLGLYSALDVTGDRITWSVLMLNAGSWGVVFSYFRVRWLRVGMNAVTCAVWAALMARLIEAGLFGGALQSGVILVFCLVILFDAAFLQEPYASPKKRAQRN